MPKSTRPQGAPGAGGGGAGSGPVPPAIGGSSSARRLLVESLLRDHADPELGRLALRLRGDLRVPHGVLVTCGAPPDAVASAQRALAGRVPRALAVGGGDSTPPHAAVVVPAPTPPAWRHALQVAAGEAERIGCLVLARPPVTGLRALRAAHGRALADAGLARAAAATGPLVMPEDLVIPRMLALLDEADQQALLAPLRPLLALPAPHRAAYLRTIDVLRRHGGTHAVAAAELHLHVNSVRYRVARIEEMTGLRLDDPGERLALDLAVMLVNLREPPPDVEAGPQDFGLAFMDAPAGRRGRGASAANWASSRGPYRPAWPGRVA